MQITIIVDDDQMWPVLHRLAEQRGCGVPALAMSFVAKELGRICLPCAGMGFERNGTNVCIVCGGDGLNPFTKPKAWDPLRICTHTGCTFQPETGNVHGPLCPEFRK